MTIVRIYTVNTLIVIKPGNIQE